LKYRWEKNTRKWR